MRKAADRIRHAVSFEIIGLLLAVPLGAWAFDKPLADIGVIGVVGATIATFWNYVYNVMFDHAMQKLRGNTRKTAWIRVLHAFLFEAGLLGMLLPLFAWYLGISLWDAFVMDISFSVFYLCYAFVFNWIYDWLFPLPEWKQAELGEARR